MASLLKNGVILFGSSFTANTRLKFTMILKHFQISAIYKEKEMLIDLAKMAKIHEFGLANSLLDSPMATWLTLTGTLTTELANSPITDAPDDIVDSLSGSFQLDFVVHDASDAVLSDFKNESATTPVDSLSTPATLS